MNIYNYIDEMGIYTFEEKPFNEVDNVLFSFLSYADYNEIVDKNKISIKDVGRIHFGLHKKNEKNIIAVKEANKLLNYIKDTNRYKNCILFNNVYEIDKESQFSAISIEYQKNKVYVSYEGTNQMISGWRENITLGYEYPTTSHKKAIKYLDKNYTFSNKSIIVGGHSKGGNLALVAAMGCRNIVRKKITAVYNIDGPGLLEKEFDSYKFKRIKPIYEHIIPDSSIVGIILNDANYSVVKSTISGPLAHNIAYWSVIYDHFEKTKLTSYSKELQKGIKQFLDNHNQEELKIIVQNLDKICQKSNVESLLDFKEDHHKIIKFLNESRCLDEEARNMLLDLINVFIKALKDSKYHDIVEFSKKFKIEIQNEFK